MQNRHNPAKATILRGRPLLFGVALVYLIFALYGSLVPLKFVPRPLPEAWAVFLNIPYLQLGIGSRADWVANILLFVPLGFFWTGVVWPNRRGAWAVILSLAVWMLCAALSLAIEFVQIFFPQRTVSQNDIIAETVGGLVGIVAWWWIGPRAWGALHGWRSGRSGTTLAERFLWVYLALLFGYSVMPLDLTLSPVEFFHKWSSGRVILVPFSFAFKNGFEMAYGIATDIAIWIPAGLLLILSGKKTPLQAWRWSVLAALLLEVLQLFVFSRLSDVTDVITGALGGGIGVLLAMRFRRGPAVDNLGNQTFSRFWLGFAAFIAWSGVLAAIFWYPYDFQFDRALAGARLAQLYRVPFYAYYYGTEFRALTEVFKNVLFFAPLGAAIAFTFRPWSRPHRSLLLATMTVVLCACVSMALELGQVILPSRVPDNTDIVLQIVGAMLGYWATLVVLHNAQGRFIPESKPDQSQRRPYLSTDEPTMTPMNVREWLKGLGLDQYAEAFSNNDIDGATLPKLTSEDLRELGVTSIGHLRRLLDAIAALSADDEIMAPATPATGALSKSQWPRDRFSSPESAAWTSKTRGTRRRRSKQPSHNTSRGRRWLYGLGFLAIAAISPFIVFGNLGLFSGPMIVQATAWAGRDARIILDHHTHTTFSDGALMPEALVDLALKSGCNAVAISDHSGTKDTASRDQLRIFNELRKRHPGLLLFGGIELNMPFYGGREHVNVLTDPAIEQEALPRLRETAEDSIARGKEEGAITAPDWNLLRLAASFVKENDGLVMTYSHPSRKDKAVDENFTDMISWNANAPLVIGFSGAPGHQNAKKIGAYDESISTIDRWDPVVAEIGGVWDRLLSEGHQIWGALAGSDYHNAKLDYPPCAFARTHVAASEFSYKAVIDALRAGTFWADHGRILDQVSFFARVRGIEAPIYPGSIVQLTEGSRRVSINLSVVRGPGSVGKPLNVEFIGNCGTGDPEMLDTKHLSAQSTSVTSVIQVASAGADNKSCFIRARVRLNKDPESDLMAYTNPIRFLLR